MIFLTDLCLVLLVASVSAQDITLVHIDPGQFEMGNSRAQSQIHREEFPVRTVKISYPFQIGATEVTRGQWKAVMGAEPPDLNLKPIFDTNFPPRGYNPLLRLMGDSILG